jgi:hypothetical protein
MRGIHRECLGLILGLCLYSHRYRKMRSDSIIASDPRASVLVAPPGADPKQYSQQHSHSNSRPDGQKWHRGGRGRGRGRGRRNGGGGERGTGMDIDS